VQDGELDPNAPIADYIDGLPEQYQDITARQLLAHTSGLPHYQAMDDNIDKTHYANAIASLASVGDRPLLTTPGDAYLYSTHGYTILGALYESITGQPLSQSAPAFVNTLTGRETPVLENFRLRDSRRSNVFDVVADGAVTLKPRDQSYSPFGTGFTASAVDLAYFGDAVLHSPLLSADTREWLFRPVMLADGGKTGSYLYEVAFGWRVSADSSGRTVYHHSGVTEGARSALVLYPESGLSIAFLCNAAWTAQIERTAFALANIVLNEQSAAMHAGKHDFIGSFDGTAISGSLTCDEGDSWCLWSDGEGALSEWLQRYAPGNAMRSDWPAQLVDGDGGTALKLLTTVGIVELHQVSADAAFMAEIGNGRILEIRFTQ
jgi:CubicO group peptidase (beta-lactamase class C family)